MSGLVIDSLYLSFLSWYHIISISITCIYLISGKHILFSFRTLLPIALRETLDGTQTIQIVHLLLHFQVLRCNFSLGLCLPLAASRNS